MKDEASLRLALQSTRILRPPKHTLSTFGTTTLRYVLLSAVPDRDDACRLREGEVTAQRPQILTPELWKKRFEGFGEDQEAYGRHLETLYGEAFRALEYQFRNNVRNTSMENTPLADMTERVSQTMAREDALRTALLEGPDDSWGLSIMKFITDVSLRSFPGNIRELEERGLFDPGAAEDQRQKRAIERLFVEAQSHPSQIQALGDFLKRTGRFKEYEDRFFSLFSRHA